MQAIFAHLTLVIRERASYETLRGLQGDASQSFLDLLQDVRLILSSVYNW
jgi:hypothetical protein